MKIQIENLKAQMQGRELNICQKADALIEFNKLLDYVQELEQCNIADVMHCFPDNPEIWKWWKEQKFQKEQGEQEYTMIYEIDLPKILKAFTEHLLNIRNITNILT